VNQIDISNRIARALVLHAQQLSGRPNGASGKQGVMQSFEQLGYIQIDTISAIQRTHHHTLWTRNQDYHPGTLHALQAEDREIFEYWAHAMAYMPMSDYRYCLPRMRNFHNPTHPWIQRQLQKCGEMLGPVLERIRVDGPLSSKDFSAGEHKAGTWWDWKPAKMALELLFWRGELMIRERRKFQKVYDLTERVLPSSVDTTMPDNDAVGQFFVRRALRALGVAQEREILKFMQPDAGRDSDWQAAGKDVLRKALDDVLAAREVTPVTIGGEQTGTYFALSKTLEAVDGLGQIRPEVHLLSPFDNLIIQRARVKRLFDFEYALECYVPAAKRRYGYFVLPILWGDSFVGRMDPKADARTKTLTVCNLVFEPAFTDFDALLPLFAVRLRDLARFNNCDHIKMEQVQPAKIRRSLKSLL